MLLDRDPRDITLGGRPATLDLGNGSLALEVVVQNGDARPGVTELRNLFKDARVEGRRRF